MDKTAKEMFAEIGFEQVKHTYAFLYIHENGMKILFDFFDERYVYGIPMGEVKEKECSICVGYGVHRAIHQQMKELGWPIE